MVLRGGKKKHSLPTFANCRIRMKIQISCRTEGILLQSSVGLQLTELTSTDGPGVNSGKL